MKIANKLKILDGNMYPTFDEKAIEILASIQREVKKFNLGGCFQLSSDLTKMCIYFESLDFILISEFFESLFNNLGNLPNIENIGDDDKINVIDKVTELITIIHSYYENPSTTLKVEIHDKMQEVRYMVTKIQYNSVMYSDRKTPRRFILDNR